MPTLEERLNRWEQRQEVLIRAVDGIAGALADISDAISELGDWLKQPAASDLSDLIRVLIVRIDTNIELAVQLGRKMDALPEALARAVTTGELPK